VRRITILHRVSRGIGERMGKKKFVREYLEPIIIAVIIALFIRTFVVQAFKIPSSSMEPTLLVGDYILVNKFIYGLGIPFTDRKLFEFKKPNRGDVIVFIFPEDRSKDFIKRVIGTEGEKVDVVREKIYVNDKVIEDPWGYYSHRNAFTRHLVPMEKFNHVTVPPNCLFVMGDNRDNSQDSRYWGFVNLNDVRGKAFIIYFSWDRTAMDWLQKIRFSRLGKLIR
jgi:signal peptidase I